jgi:hypothetical protein
VSWSHWWAQHVGLHNWPGEHLLVCPQILVNFVQVTAVIGSVTLEWPDAVNAFIVTVNSFASSGSNTFVSGAAYADELPCPWHAQGTFQSIGNLSLTTSGFVMPMVFALQVSMDCSLSSRNAPKAVQTVGVDGPGAGCRLPHVGPAPAAFCARISPCWSSCVDHVVEQGRA